MLLFQAFNAAHCRHVLHFHRAVLCLHISMRVCVQQSIDQLRSHVRQGCMELMTAQPQQRSHAHTATTDLKTAALTSLSKPNGEERFVDPPATSLKMAVTI